MVDSGETGFVVAGETDRIVGKKSVVESLKPVVTRLWSRMCALELDRLVW